MEELPRLAFSAKEVAQQIGSSKNTVYRMMDSGELSYIKTGPRGKRIPQWAIDEWMNRNRKTNAS